MTTSSISRYFTLREELNRSLLGYFNADETIVPDHARQGSIKLVDALLLAEMLQRERPANILELGSFIGFSTRWILECTAETRARVTSLDPGIPHRVFDDTRGHLRHFCRHFEYRLNCKTAFMPPVNYARLAAHFHKTGDFPGSPTKIEQTLRAIPVADSPFDTFDFAFIDGNHGYAPTRGNSIRVARMIRPGGMIIVHDAVTWPQVVPALRDLVAETDGALELLEVIGYALHKDLRPYFEDRMTPRNAQLACATFCDGMAVLRVHAPLPAALQPDG